MRSRPVRGLQVTLAIVAGLVVYDLAIAVFERLAPRPWVVAFRRFANPRSMAILGVIPGWAIVETTGHKTGTTRRHPVGGRLQGDTYWFVAVEPATSAYVRNIEANPSVRVKVHGRWRAGVARVLVDDDATRRMRRLNPLNSLFIWIAAREHVTVRVDLVPRTARRRSDEPADLAGP